MSRVSRVAQRAEASNACLKPGRDCCLKVRRPPPPLRCKPLVETEKTGWLPHFHFPPKVRAWGLGFRV